MPGIASNPIAASAGDVSKPQEDSIDRLTSINIFDRGLRQRASHCLFRTLCLEFLTYGIIAAGIERPLEAVALPAEDVVAMLRVPGPLRSK